MTGKPYSGWKALFQALRDTVASIHFSEVSLNGTLVAPRLLLSVTSNLSIEGRTVTAVQYNV